MTKGPDRLAALAASMREPTPQARLLAMLYGAGGAGKTVEAMMLAQAIIKPGERIFYVDTADGWVSLKNHNGLMRNVQMFEYKGLSQIDTMGDAIKAALDPKSVEMHEFDPYRSVGAIILDEATSMADFDLDVVTMARADANEEFGADRPEWDDRNIATNRYRKSLYKLIKDTKASIILIAHDREDKNKKQVTVTCPAFPEKIRYHVGHPLHLIGYMTAKYERAGDEPVYTRNIQCWPTNMAEAKSRIGLLKMNETPDSLISKVATWLEAGGNDEEEAPLVTVGKSEYSGVEV